MGCIGILRVALKGWHKDFNFREGGKKRDDIKKWGMGGLKKKCGKIDDLCS